LVGYIKVWRNIFIFELQQLFVVYRCIPFCIFWKIHLIQTHEPLKTNLVLLCWLVYILLVTIISRNIFTIRLLVCKLRNLVNWICISRLGLIILRKCAKLGLLYRLIIIIWILILVKGLLAEILSIHIKILRILRLLKVIY
jgi:hypothetical protein